MIKILSTIFFLSTAPNLWSRSTFLPGTFKAEFNQIHKSSITGKEKKSRGLLEYKYPGHIRFETTHPDTIVFVSNPDKTWYYTAPVIEGEPGELTISNSNRNSLVKFFDLLRKGLVSNKMYKVFKKKGDREIQFSKANQEDLGIAKALLIFKGKDDFKNLKEVLLTKTDKSQLRLVLEEVRPNLVFQASHFTFKTPKNTRVSQ